MGLKLRRDVWAGNKYGSHLPINSDEVWEEIILARELMKNGKRPQWKPMLHHYVEVPKYEDRNMTEKKIVTTC